MNTNWKWQPQKVTLQNNSVNKHIKTILLDYFRISTKKELLFDLAIPSIISIILFVIIALFSTYANDIIIIFNVIITNSLAVMAILAGFNTACLSVIASTNRQTLRKLIKAIPENEEKKESILKIIITFFSYAISIQIILLIVGFIYILFNESARDIYIYLGFINTNVAKVVASIIGALLSACILHTLFVSLRNVSLLFRYILFVAESDE